MTAVSLEMSDEPKISAPEGCFVKLFHIHRLQYLRQPDKTEWVDIRERQPPPLHISLLEGMPHGRVLLVCPVVVKLPPASRKYPPGTPADMYIRLLGQCNA